MRVLLVSTNTETVAMRAVPFGLGCVAAATRAAGHDVMLLDLAAHEEPLDALRDALTDVRPEVIGLSVRNVDDQNGLQPTFLLAKVRDVVAVCRAHSEAPIVLGGAGYSIFPAAALDYLGADMGIRGEGEVAFPLLLEALANGEREPRVAGLYLRGRGCVSERRLVSDLAALPLPDDDLLDICGVRDTDVWLPAQSRRGCGLHCIYCSTPAIEGRAPRQRAAAEVAQWVARNAERGFRRVFFVDNNFNLPRRYTLELCRHLAELPFELELHCIFNALQADEAVVAALAQAGCAEVSLGFEAGNDAMLEAQQKGFTVAEVRQLNAMLGEYGIRRMGFLLLGMPGETRETVEQSLAFAASLEIEAMRVTSGVRVYPESPLHERLVREGVLAPDDDLLQPYFYVEPHLADWLPERLARCREEHPDWIV